MSFVYVMFNIVFLVSLVFVVVLLVFFVLSFQ